MVILVEEGAFGRLLLRDSVLHLSQACLEFSIRGFHKAAFRLRRSILCGCTLLPHLRDEGRRDVAVTVRVLLKILLMLLLRTVEVHNRPRLDRKRLADLFLKGIQRCADHCRIRILTAVRVRRIVDAGAVLRSDVVALPVLRRRINGVIKSGQKAVKIYNARIVDNVHCLCMTAPAAHLTV